MPKFIRLCKALSKQISSKVKLLLFHTLIKEMIVALIFLSVAGISVAGTENYTYDPLGRLLTVVYPTGAQMTYAYDAVGNRKSSVLTTLPPPAQGIFTYVMNGGHSKNGTMDDLITFTIKNTGTGTITSASASCSGGSFVPTGNFWLYAVLSGNGRPAR